MKKSLQKNTYKQLVKDITELYRAKALQNATILPSSQDFAAGGEIELAYHRIQQPAAELNWSQHVELLPVTNNGARSILFGPGLAVGLASLHGVRYLPEGLSHRHI